MSKINRSDNDGDAGESLGLNVLPFAGLFITGGALGALILALRRVRRTDLWAISLGLFGVGIALTVKPVRRRQARIKATQQEIISLLDQLDPVAKAQVAKYVAEAEWGKR